MIVYVDDFVKDRKNAACGIREATACAARSGADVLQFSEGEYHLEDYLTIETESIAHDDGCGDIHTKDCHIVMEKLSSLIIRGADKGKRTVLSGANPEQLQALMPSVLWAVDCKNLTLEHLTFTRAPQTVYCGEIIKIEQGCIFVKLRGQIPKKNQLGAYCMNRFSVKTGELLGESLTFGFGYDHVFERVAGDIFFLQDMALADKVKVGEGLSFHQAGKTDFLLFFGNCSDLTLRDIEIQNTNGFAVLTENCRNIHADRLKIAPLPKQVFTGPRDGWKVYRCSGRILVENSHFEGVRMDGQNVQSNYLKVEKVVDKKTILCSCKYAPVPIEKNARLQSDNGGKHSEYVIASSGIVESRMEKAVQSSDLSAGRVVDGSKNYIRIYKIELEKSIEPEELKQGQLLTASCWEPREYICRNTVFRNIAGAASLIRCHDVLLENNLYENIMCAGIMMGAELDTHCESGHVRRVIIRRNVFSNIGFKPRYGIYGCACIAVKSQGFCEPCNRDILIENNVFKNSRTAIEIYDAENVLIQNNQYMNIEKHVKIDHPSTGKIEIREGTEKDDS